MKKLFCFLLLLPAACLNAQIGVKAGINFANITNASSVNGSSRSGFHVAVFLAPPSQSVMGSRTELSFSRQGFNYGTGTNGGNVGLDYLTLGQYMSIRATKYIRILLGAQTSYLLNAKVDSSQASSGTGGYGKIMDYYNKIDVGYGGGLEIHPVSGFLIGAKFSISLSNLYKGYSSGNPGEAPSFVPTVNVRNNLFQIFAGWEFGKQESKKKKKEVNQ